MCIWVRGLPNERRMALPRLLLQFPQHLFRLVLALLRHLGLHLPALWW